MFLNKPEKVLNFFGGEKQGAENLYFDDVHKQKLCSTCANSFSVKYLAF